jgi:hypothetical protein
LISEIGDFARFSHPRELACWLGIVPSEYSSGEQQHRGHITRAGNRHARRLLIEAAWHYRHAPRRPASGPQPDERAWQAQVRHRHRHRHLAEHGKRPTVVNVAIARELTGFLEPTAGSVGRFTVRVGVGRGRRVTASRAR